MKKKFNITFIIVFIVHFAALSTLFVQNFETIAFGKLQFVSDKPLELNRTYDIREFEVTKTTKADKVPVLMYHRIIKSTDLQTTHYNEEGELYGTIVTEEQFEEQMSYLHEEGYTTLTLAEFQAYMEKEIEVPNKSVLITFDDGFKDNYINAYPILKKYDLRATIFLIAGNIDRDPRDYDPADAQFLSVEDIEASTDIFDYESHTYKFHERDENGAAFLTSKPREDVFEDIEIGIELVGSNTAFAYPFGEYDADTLTMLDQLGVDMAFTIKDGMAKSGVSMLEIPRRGIYPGTTMDIFKLLLTYE